MTTHQDHISYLAPHLMMHADEATVACIDRLDLDQMDRAAMAATIPMINGEGSTVLFAPGDSTRYMIGVEHQGDLAYKHPREHTNAKYWVSWDYGPSYGWEGHPLHPDYVATKWSRDGNPTGSTLVLAVYLALLSRALHTEGLIT